MTRNSSITLEDIRKIQLPAKNRSFRVAKNALNEALRLGAQTKVLEKLLTHRKALARKRMHQANLPAFGLCDVACDVTDLSTLQIAPEHSKQGSSMKMDLSRWSH